MLTEQQIDAEVSRYQPYLMWRDAWTWFIWVPSIAPRGPEDVPLNVHRKLTRRGANYYPTREAAFADLRQAFKASALTPASE